MTDILCLIQQDGHSLKRIASTGGGEYCGACPFCGGNDRFRVWGNKGRFWCRGCGKAGDSIQYIRETRGLSYVDALKYLGMEGNKNTARKKKEKYTFHPEEKGTPPAQWQEKAQKFLLWTQAQLWTPGGAAALNVLTGRGLTRETIRAAGIGANTGERGGDIYRDFPSWGLPPEFKENGKQRKLWVPTGIIIPLINEGIIERLRVRRDNPQDGQRYIVVHGSTSRPLILGKDRKFFLIVESELDGWLCWQDAGALAGIIALGSAGLKPDKETHNILLKAERILLSLDYDEAGAKAAYNFWPQTYGEKVIRWPTPEGKDASEAYQKGINIRAWVEAGLE